MKSVPNPFTRFFSNWGTYASIAAVFSFPILFSRLEGDEVFVVFNIGQNFYTHPYEIFRRAYNSSLEGWHTGRYIPFWSHFLSNLGVATSYATSKIPGFDILSAYAFWRMAMLFIIAFLFCKIVSIFLPRNSSLTLSGNNFKFGFITFFACVISNDAWSATRMDVWSYSLFFALSMAFFYLTLRAFEKYQEMNGRLVTLLLIVLLGIMLGSTYEMTQVIFPVVVLGCFFLKYDRLSWTNLKLFLVPRNRAFWALSISYLTTFVFIRLHNMVGCLHGCYGTANIKATSFSLSSFALRILSAFTPIAFSHNFIIGKVHFNDFTVILCCIVISYFTYFLLRNYFRGETNPTHKNASWSTFNRRYFDARIFSIGIVLILSVSLGMSLSAVYSRQNLLRNLGISSIDTLALNCGFSFIVFSFYPLIENFSIKRIFRSAYLFVIVGFSFLSSFTNISETKYELRLPDTSMQRIINQNLTSPYFGPGGDSIRCQLVMEDLKNLRQWRGHDAMYIDGLNQIMLERFGIPFCSIPLDTLFAEYPSQ